MHKYQKYESLVWRHIAQAELELKRREDREGFVIGAVLRFWEAYRRDREISEFEFDRLVAILTAFSNGEYKDFILKQVKMYKEGEPPIIIGY